MATGTGCPDGGSEGPAPASGRLRRDPAKGASLRLEGPWDWSRAVAVVWEARAATGARVHVTVEHGAARRWTFYFVPKPGLWLRVAVPAAALRVRPANTSWPGYFTFGGGPDPVDLGAVRALVFTYDQDGPPADLEIRDLRGEEGPPVPAPAVLDPRPVVDGWGQWTGDGGAPRSEAEIRALWAAEARTSAQWGDRSRWGGDGRHRLDATGRFRVDRFRDRACLVDPDGHPFFSVGPDVLQPAAPGPVAGREALFADAGEARAGTAAEGQADFHALALRRRYGPSWAPDWAHNARDRLRRWGFNTIANWSADRMFAGGGTPWVTGLRGCSAWCHRVPDVFDPRFPARAEEAVREQVAEHARDAALIGYFVGNEPLWTFPGAIHPFQTAFDGNHAHTAAAAVEWLRQRYGGDVGPLATAWGCDLGSWDEVARAGPPDPRTGNEALRRDAMEFGGRILERFYGVCCGAVRRLDPGRLLLGARFYSAAMPEPYLRACAAFDVVSFNCYQTAPPVAVVDRFAAVTGRPAMIGEFHFGVCGRGSSGALITVGDDQARGEAYAAYVRAAASHPALVGAHWFQWVDEPVTGRFDGEDYNIGLVDVTDVPYAGLAAGAERAHRELYGVRFGES